LLVRKRFIERFVYRAVRQCKYAINAPVAPWRRVNALYYSLIVLTEYASY